MEVGPARPDCSRCIGFRLDAETFAPSRSQRGVLARNRDVAIRVGKPRPSREKRALYLRYQENQHHRRPPAESTPRKFDRAMELATMKFQMYTNPPETRELEMHLDGRLIGFGILDVAVETVSAVYFVFDHEFGRRSLGTLNILKSLEWTRDSGMRYLNLGFYIAGHSKMGYKERFTPHERMVLDEGEWRRFD